MFGSSGRAAGLAAQHQLRLLSRTCDVLANCPKEEEEAIVRTLVAFASRIEGDERRQALNRVAQAAIAGMSTQGAAAAVPLLTAASQALEPQPATELLRFLGEGLSKWPGGGDQMIAGIVCVGEQLRARRDATEDDAIRRSCSDALDVMLQHAGIIRSGLGGPASAIPDAMLTRVVPLMLEARGGMSLWSQADLLLAMAQTSYRHEPPDKKLANMVAIARAIVDTMTRIGAPEDRPPTLDECEVALAHLVNHAVAIAQGGDRGLLDALREALETDAPPWVKMQLADASLEAMLRPVENALAAGDGRAIGRMLAATLQPESLNRLSRELRLRLLESIGARMPAVAHTIRSDVLRHLAGRLLPAEASPNTGWRADMCAFMVGLRRVDRDTFDAFSGTCLTTAIAESDAKDVDDVERAAQEFHESRVQFCRETRLPPSMLLPPIETIPERLWAEPERP